MKIALALPRLVLPVLAGLTLLAAPALADPITGVLSVEGSDLYSTVGNTLTFIPGSGTIGGLSTGSLAPFTAGNPVTLFNFNFDGTFVPGSEAFTTTEGGTTLSLVLNSMTSHVSVNDGLVINAIGTLTETGYTPTLANYTLTSQDGGHDVNEVTFSSTAISPSITPEPSSVVLLGTGLLGMAGLMRRKLKQLSRTPAVELI